MTGLGTLATMTGGAFYQAAGSGAGIFSRITSAMSGFYQLGIETTPADRSGGTKPIEVRTAETGPDRALWASRLQPRTGRRR